MANKTIDEVAASISQLHATDFGDRLRGNYLLAREDFRQLAARQRIEKSIFDGVAEKLRLEHGLLLVDGGEYYAVIEAARISRLRFAPRKVIQAEAKRRTAMRAPARTPAPVKEAVSPAAAWPFPSSSRP